MSLAKTVYSVFFRRSATITFVTVVGVFAYERVINKATDYLFERHNQGKLWKTVQPQFKLAQDEESSE